MHAKILAILVALLPCSIASSDKAKAPLTALQADVKEDGEVCSALQVSKSKARRERATSEDVSVDSPVPYDPTATLRGGTWCELNALLPGREAITVETCQNGPLIPGPQNGTDCCPYNNFKAIYDPVGDDDISTLRTPAAVWMATYRPPSVYGNYTGSYERMDMFHRKGLWDTFQMCGSDGQEEPDVPESLVCTDEGDAALKNTRDHSCMWFTAYGAINVGGDLIAWEERFTPGHPKMEFVTGKRNPIITTDTGDSWILKTYLTTQANGSSVIPGGTFVPGEDENLCDYLDGCCSSLAEQKPGWTVSCGVLQETATCGFSCNGVSVMADDISGVWCLTDTGAVVG